MNGHIPHSLENIDAIDKNEQVIIYYTCSAPNERTLKKYGIQTIGEQFGCADSREVLRIPIKICNKFGIYDFSDRSSLTINLEGFLEKISRS